MYPTSLGWILASAWGVLCHQIGTYQVYGFKRIRSAIALISSRKSYAIADISQATACKRVCRGHTSCTWQNNWKSDST